jgi:hypothetical protein
MPKATYSGLRFGVRPHEVPGDDQHWAVFDAGFTLARTGEPRAVAVCLDRREATAIASFLNDDLEGGRRLFKDCLSQLDFA